MEATAASRPTRMCSSPASISGSRIQRKTFAQVMRVGGLVTTPPLLLVGVTQPELIA
jgi:hypothetical protein